MKNEKNFIFCDVKMKNKNPIESITWENIYI